MDSIRYQGRLQKCTQLMKAAGMHILLLAKPANMAYLTGDGRLCAFAMITQNGKVALGVPKTDVEDVKNLARFDQIIGFEDEVGMIHSIAGHFSYDFCHAPGIAGWGMEAHREVDSPLFLRVKSGSGFNGPL